MQAIQTKYLPATNTKCSRIKAWCDAGFIIMSYDHDHDEAGAHHKVAQALVEKLGWVGKYYGQLCQGSLPGNVGYCFVMAGVKS